VFRAKLIFSVRLPNARVGTVDKFQGQQAPVVIYSMTTSSPEDAQRPGQVATENTVVPPNFPFPRVSEQTALALVPKGVRASVMRLPQVHNTVKQGPITYLIEVARAKGVSASVGEGRNRWAAAHVSDVAHLYRLALKTTKRVRSITRWRKKVCQCGMLPKSLVTA
jgi:hypothetical protein